MLVSYPDFIYSTVYIASTLSTFTITRVTICSFYKISLREHGTTNDMNIRKFKQVYSVCIVLLKPALVIVKI
jgi:hypothetical protein